MTTIAGTAVREDAPARTRAPGVAPDPAAAPLATATKTGTVAKRQANATTLLMAITQAAKDPAVDITKMERLFAMHQQMVKQEAEAAFHAAKSRAQAELTPVAAKAWNDQTKSNYAKLDAINKMAMPIITKHGLSLSFDTADCPTPNWVRTIGILAHEAGHNREYHIDLPPDATGAKGTVNKTVVHAIGSTSSYARRYLVFLMFNIATGDDNDGNGAGQNGNTETGGQQGAPDPKRPAGKPPYPDAKLNEANFGTWSELVGGGTHSAEEIIATIRAKHTLSEEQEKKIRDAITPKEPKK